MSARRKTSEAEPFFLNDIDELFPFPGSFRMSDLKQFLSVRNEIAKSVEPENFLEKIYVNELAHLVWQIREKRGAISSLTANAQEEGLIRLLAGRHGDLSSLVKALRRRDPEAMKTVKSLMEEFEITYADVDAHARSAIGEEISKLERDCVELREQFDRLVQSFEKRRFIIAERLRRFTEAPPIDAKPSLKLEGGKSE